MTGEMSKADVTKDAYPLHFAVARSLKGTVEPFDVYQGPYVRTAAGRLFLTTDDGIVAQWWNEATCQMSRMFWCHASDLSIRRMACRAARDVA